MRILVAALCLACATTAKVSAPNVSQAVSRFMVITQPRSGSTWFVKYSEHFARCSGVVTTGEIMHPKVIKQLSSQILGKSMTEQPKHADYLRYVRGVFDALAQGDGLGESRHAQPERIRAVGFKLMYAQLPQMGPGAPVGDSGMMRNVTLKGLLKYAAMSRVTVIHLHRVNHLERHISLEAIRKSNLTYHDNGLPTHYSFGGNTAKISLDATAAFQFARAQLKQNQNLQHFLDRYCVQFGATCHTVAYEHLRAEQSGKHFAALRHALGVKTCHLKRPTKPVMVEEDPAANWLPCEDRVTNWSEVAERFENSVWLDMCKNGNKIPEWLEALADDGRKHDDAPLLRLDPAAFERGIFATNTDNDIPQPFPPLPSVDRTKFFVATATGRLGLRSPLALPAPPPPPPPPRLQHSNALRRSSRPPLVNKRHSMPPPKRHKRTAAMMRVK